MTLMYVVVATLCKEQGITVVGVCAVYDVLILQKVCSLFTLIVLHYKSSFTEYRQASL